MNPCSSRGSAALGPLADRVWVAVELPPALDRDLAAWVPAVPRALELVGGGEVVAGPPVSGGSPASPVAGEIVSGWPGSGAPLPTGSRLTISSLWGGSLVGDWLRAAIPAAAAPLTTVTEVAASSPAENQPARARSPPLMWSPHWTHQSCSSSRGAWQWGQRRSCGLLRPFFGSSFIPPHCCIAAAAGRRQPAPCRLA